MNKKLLLLCATALVIASCGSKYKYEQVDGDPLKARIYTLDNGLKVYMTVNKETPRIQTYIATHVGSKNDPLETTGLAHYFEHLMFKGTSSFGTQNYEQEKPLLDQIEQLFELYRKTEDPGQRTAIYRRIDSISGEASKYAIPNEYDKLMAAIGAQGTNAWTSYDETVYTEDIPSNQIENWAKIQRDRFADNVIRGFHTELETVYEEFNMSLTRDQSKVFDALLAQLFPHHPYGMHSVLGYQDHLKNPSITNIKNYYKQYYVPNNMAICLSGDFDPDQMIQVIDQYFGDLKPNENLMNLRQEIKDKYSLESNIKENTTIEVFGNEAEYMVMAWPVANQTTDKAPLNEILSQLVSNDKAGIFDLNLNQAQKVLYSYGMVEDLAEASGFFVMAAPKQGQTLDQVRDLITVEIGKIAAGDFDETLLKSIVNNIKLARMNQLEDNGSRAHFFVKAFINDLPWEKVVKDMDALSHVTKEDIMAYANEYLTRPYICVYKREGEDKSVKKIEKPKITPIQTNRDAISPFLAAIQNKPVKPIEPVFVDFDKDLQKTLLAEGTKMVYANNKLNDIFSLSFIYETGTDDDPALEMAPSYIQYLGTSTKSAAEVQKAFYDLACSYNIQVSNDRTNITLGGLSENMAAALDLLQEVLTDAQPNAAIYAAMVEDMLKVRDDNKKDQRTCFSRLANYALFGPEYAQDILSEKELRNMDPATLANKFKDFTAKQHTVLCYAPQQAQAVTSILKEHRPLAEKPEALSGKSKYRYNPTPENIIYMAHYDAKQIYFAGFGIREGEFHNPDTYSINQLYNEYFGGGMNSIVFQEMREARALCYSANAAYMTPRRLDREYVMREFIATQNDKAVESMEAFDDIINNMPESEAALNIAKESLISAIRTERYTGAGLLKYWYDQQLLNQTTDPRKIAFDRIPTLTLADVKAYQEASVKNRTYHYCILGDEKDLDLAGLAKYGRIVMLSQKDIFGY